MSGGGADCRDYDHEETTAFNNAMKVVEKVQNLAIQSGLDILYCLRTIALNDLELLLQVHTNQQTFFKLLPGALDAVIAELAQRSLLEVVDE